MSALANCDEFTRAYIHTALWSSNEHKYGECPCCGKLAVLDRYPEPEFEEEAMCGAEGCGVREIASPEPMDSNYKPDDLAPTTLAAMRADCAQFQAEQGDTLAAAIATGEVRAGPDFGPIGRAGHDFWLTRCGHGCGFWDGDWPEPMAETLSEAARTFGNVDLYVGDDGKIHA